MDLKYTGINRNPFLNKYFFNKNKNYGNVFKRRMTMLLNWRVIPVGYENFINVRVKKVKKGGCLIFVIPLELVKLSLSKRFTMHLNTSFTSTTLSTSSLGMTTIFMIQPPLKYLTLPFLMILKKI
jgi:hypothetical protein